MTLRKRMIALGALATGTALALAGCTGGGSTTGGGGASSGGSASGSTVTIGGGFTGAQGEAFQNDLTAWGKTKGITVKYSGSDSFQTSIITQVRGGTAPDVAIFPQPGVLKGLIGNGMVALDDLIDVKTAVADEANGLPDVAKVNGKTYGLPYNINVKSLVWYNPAAFKKAGYAVPTTDAEMDALSKKIIADGTGYPWCVGIESGTATGWAMTDWLEEYVLRYGGLQQYTDWINHKVLFDSPLVTKAADKVSQTILQPGQVNGGGKAIVATNFGTAGNDLFVSGKSKGQCFMMRQGTFITGNFPKTIQDQIAKSDLTNVNAFPLPTPDGATSATLGAGDLVAAFKNNAGVKEVVTYLTGKTFGTNGYAKEWSAALSAHNDFDTSLYTSPFQKVAADSVKNSKIFGFDASDQMPGAVGSGTEWTNLTQWTSGQESLDAALKAIDASWPSS